MSTTMLRPRSPHTKSVYPTDNHYNLSAAREEVSQLLQIVSEQKRTINSLSNQLAVVSSKSPPTPPAQAPPAYSNPNSNANSFVTHQHNLDILDIPPLEASTTPPRREKSISADSLQSRSSISTNNSTASHLSPHVSIISTSPARNIVYRADQFDLHTQHTSSKTSSSVATGITSLTIPPPRRLSLREAERERHEREQQRELQRERDRDRQVMREGARSSSPAPAPPAKDTPKSSPTQLWKTTTQSSTTQSLTPTVSRVISPPTLMSLSSIPIKQPPSRESLPAVPFSPLYISALNDGSAAVNTLVGLKMMSPIRVKIDTPYLSKAKLVGGHAIFSKYESVAVLSIYFEDVKLWDIQKQHVSFLALDSAIRQLLGNKYHLPALPDKKPIFTSDSSTVQQFRNEFLQRYFHSLLEMENNLEDILLEILQAFLSTDKIPGTEAVILNVAANSQTAAPTADGLSPTTSPSKAMEGFLTIRDSASATEFHRVYCRLFGNTLSTYLDEAGPFIEAIDLQFSVVEKLNIVQGEPPSAGTAGSPANSPGDNSDGDENERVEIFYSKSYECAEAFYIQEGRHQRHIFCCNSRRQRSKWLAALHTANGNLARRKSMDSMVSNLSQITTNTSFTTPMNSTLSHGNHLSMKKVANPPLSTRVAQKSLLKKVPAKKRTGFFSRSEPSKQVLLFGRPLEDAVDLSSRAFEGSLVPSIVERCVTYLLSTGAYKEEGIFRISGSIVLVRSLMSKFQGEFDVDLEAHLGRNEHNAVCALLKLYLRELPDDLVPDVIYKKAVQKVKQTRVVDSIRDLEIVRECLGNLDQHYYDLLRVVFRLCSVIIKNSRYNRMNPNNMEIVLLPTIKLPPVVLRALLEDYDSLFNVVQL